MSFPRKKANTLFGHHVFYQNKSLVKIEGCENKKSLHTLSRQLRKMLLNLNIEEILSKHKLLKVGVAWEPGFGKIVRVSFPD